MTTQVSNLNKVLWQPCKNRVECANIHGFIKLVNSEFSLSLKTYFELYQWSVAKPQEFWRLLWLFSGALGELHDDITLQVTNQLSAARWFPNTRLNYAENLLNNQNPQQLAIIFQGEHGVRVRLSHLDLYHRVSQLTLALRAQGIKPGDRVAGVLPNSPEAVIAMLAVTSIGAIWSSCSPDFGIAGIVDRFGQIEPELLFISDGYYFNGKVFDRTLQIEPLLSELPSVKKAVLVSYIDSANSIACHQLVLWQEFVAAFPDSEPIQFTRMGFNDPLFIMYSSGTTGPPKCIVHGIGGTLLQHLKEHQLHVDVHPGNRMFYFTTCGWMMWNWLISGLASGATIVLYDGAPLYPASVLLDLIDEYGINIFGVSAKYIDTIRKAHLTPKNTHSLASLATILSTGSPLMPEAFDYIYDAVKTDVCLSSISGGTDIISCFVLGCPVLPVHRGEIQCRGLAMQVDVYNDKGESLTDAKGELVCSAPFPSMPLQFWNDPGQKKFQAAYFEKYTNVWCQGDYAAITDNQGMIIYGRSDTVLNPGGVRIGTAEIYRQVEQLDEILESLVVGAELENDCKVILFVRLNMGVKLDDELKLKIKAYIRLNASPRHVPAEIFQVTDIPRTKSGKIVELAVRNIMHNRPVENQHALANPEVLSQYEQIARELNNTILT